MRHYQRVFFFLFWMVAITPFLYGRTPARYYYQLKIYHLKTAAQEALTDKFLQTAYLPALHRAGIKNIGVFKPIEKDSLQHVYVLIPFKSLEQFTGLEKVLQKDQQYQTDGKEFLNASFDSIPYERQEVMLLQAFESMPAPAIPQLHAPKEERVYELRSYESPTEKYHVNKVQMFNGGEVALFSKLGFNALFYASVVSGNKMPNLMYMTCFDNKAGRDDHWKNFSADETWKKMSALPEYQHNVSKITITFLRPVMYSDF